MESLGENPSVSLVVFWGQFFVFVFFFLKYNSQMLPINTGQLNTSNVRFH